MKKRFLSLLVVGLLGVVACQPAEPSEPSSVSSSVGGDLTTEPAPTTEPTPEPEPDPKPEGPTGLEKVLAQLDDIALSGTLTQVLNFEGLSYEETDVTTTKQYFGDGRYYNVEYDDQGEVLYDQDFSRSENGNLGVAALDPYTNTPVVLELVDDYNQLIPFESFQNPFPSLKTTDLLETPEGIKVNLDEAGITELGVFLTQYSLSFQDLTILVDGDYNVTGLSLYGVTEDQLDYYLGSYDVTFSAEYTVSTKEELGIPTIEPREDKGETGEIKELFEQLQQLNFTETIVNIMSVLDYGSTADYTSTYKVDGNAFIQSGSANELGGDAGFIQTDAGVKDFSIENGVPTQQTNSIYAENLGDLFPTYALDYMFDKTGENTWTLATGLNLDLFDAYVPFAATDVWNYSAFDEGTLTFTKNADSTWTIEFSYSVVDMFGPMKDEYTITISDIGTTTTGVTVDSFVPIKRQEGWNDVDWFEEDHGENLPSIGIPFWLPDDGGEWWSGYNFIGLRLDDSEMDATEAMEEYGQKLVAAGWTYVGIASNGEPEYNYIDETEGIKYVITLDDYYDGTLRVWIYPPETYYPETALSKWLEEKFSDRSTINYTADFTVTEYTYEAGLDESGNPKITNQTPTSTVVGTGTSKAVPGGFYSYLQTYDQKPLVQLIDNRVEGTSVLYANDYAPADDPDALGYLQTYKAPWTALSYSLYDLAGYDQFTWDDTYDDYICTEPEVLDTLLNIGMVAFPVSGDYYLPTYATFELDETNNTLTIEYDLRSGYFYTDSSYETIVYVEDIMTIEVKDVGTTSIDWDALIPAETEAPAEPGA